MNKVILIGRLTRDPEVRYSAGEESICIAKYTLAVDREVKKDGEQNADFINCVAFKRKGEFAEKYLKKGVKIAISGSIQTGSYVNNQGVKVYTTDVIIDSQEFVEKKAESSEEKRTEEQNVVPTGFSDIPDDMAELPFD